LGSHHRICSRDRRVLRLGEPSDAEGARTLTPKDVEAALAELLDPRAHDHDTWDLFLGWPIDDLYLESIRLECLRVCQECPPALGRDINEATVRGGGVLCPVGSTDVFRRALKASAVACGGDGSDWGADHARGHGPWSLMPRCLCSA